MFREQSTWDRKCDTHRDVHVSMHVYGTKSGAANSLSNIKGFWGVGQNDLISNTGTPLLLTSQNYIVFSSRAVQEFRLQPLKASITDVSPIRLQQSVVGHSEQTD